MIAKRYPIFGEMLMEQLPWLPAGTRRAVIDIPADGIVTVYIEVMADWDQLSVNALAALTGGEVVTVAAKAAEAQPARKALDTCSKTDRRPAASLDLSNPPDDFTAIENRPK